MCEHHTHGIHPRLVGCISEGPENTTLKVVTEQELDPHLTPCIPCQNLQLMQQFPMLGKHGYRNQFAFQVKELSFKGNNYISLLTGAVEILNYINLCFLVIFLAF